jgi:hypothetical protein
VAALLAVVGALVVVGLVLYGFVSAPGWVVAPAALGVAPAGLRRRGGRLPR